MAARKKAAPDPEPAEKPDVQESAEVEADEVKDQVDSDPTHVDSEPISGDEPRMVEADEVTPTNDSDPTPAESEPPARYEDGGLAALQAKFDDAGRKGYFGPDKEL